MINDIIKTTEQRMAKTIDSMKGEFSKLRTGRAHSSLLDHVTVPYYGNPMPLNQVANVNATDARTLSVSPWEKNLVSAIEKAIREADLGLNPVTVGDLIRIPIPALNEERRRQLTKVVKGEAENAKVAVRNVRRDANTHIKELLKDKKISEDDERRGEEQVQKLTDKVIIDIDKLLVAKEAELMEV